VRYSLRQLSTGAGVDFKGKILPTRVKRQGDNNTHFRLTSQQLYLLLPKCKNFYSLVAFHNIQITVAVPAEKTLYISPLFSPAPPQRASCPQK